MIAHLVMLGAGLICFGTACYTRAPLALLTSLVMLGAMMHHAVNLGVSAVVWAALLIIGGVLLGAQLRFAPHPRREIEAEPTSPIFTLRLNPGVLTAISFPIMAFFVLFGATSTTASGKLEQQKVHLAHHAGVDALGGGVAIVWFASLIVSMLFVIVSVAEIRKRRMVTGVETLGMAAMLWGALAAV